MFPKNGIASMSYIYSSNPENRVDFEGKNLEDLLVEVISNSVGPDLFEELKNLDVQNLKFPEENGEE